MENSFLNADASIASAQEFIAKYAEERKIKFHLFIRFFFCIIFVGYGTLRFGTSGFLSGRNILCRSGFPAFIIFLYVRDTGRRNIYLRKSGFGEIIKSLPGTLLRQNFTGITPVMNFTGRGISRKNRQKILWRCCKFFRIR